jgi:ribosomal protein S18 acetylase RimI-like enzyme
VTVRLAEAGDASDIARLLDAFNREYDEPTPGVEVLAERAARLIDRGEIIVFLAADGPDGVAQLTFRTSIWSDAPDAYLAELYVAPERRGQGLGRALLDAAIDAARAAGAEVIDLNTSDGDVAAIGLYESAGFTNREGRPDGPPMRYYELDL